MKKELLIYMGIFLFLALGMHKDQWLSHPIEHIANLPTSGALFLGAEHPFVFTFIVYVIVWLFRLPFRKRANKED